METPAALAAARGLQTSRTSSSTHRYTATPHTSTPALSFQTSVKSPGYMSARDTVGPCCLESIPNIPVGQATPLHHHVILSPGRLHTKRSHACPHTHRVPSSDSAARHGPHTHTVYAVRSFAASCQAYTRVHPPTPTQHGPTAVRLLNIVSCRQPNRLAAPHI